MDKREKTVGKSFTQRNPTKVNLSPKLSIICAQYEINPEVSESNYI